MNNKIFFLQDLKRNVFEIGFGKLAYLDLLMWVKSLMDLIKKFIKPNENICIYESEHCYFLKQNKIMDK